MWGCSEDDICSGLRTNNGSLPGLAFKVGPNTLGFDFLQLDGVKTSGHISTAPAVPDTVTYSSEMTCEVLHPLMFISSDSARALRPHMQGHISNGIEVR